VTAEETRKPRVLAVDVDGVLVRGKDNDRFYWQDALARDFGIGQDELQEFFGADWDACIVGEADLRDVLPGYLETWGFTGGVDDFVAYWFSQDCRLDDALMADLDRMRSTYRLVLATNQDRHRAHFLWNDLEFSRLFERMFASSALGVRKPDHGFWHRVTATLGTERPADILLIDDSEKNVAAARDFGWQAIHYRDRSDLDGLLGPTPAH
jgi:putative hydrolase of the HAD superfamily